MTEPKFNVDDNVQRTDIQDTKTYTITKVRRWRGVWISQ